MSIRGARASQVRTHSWQGREGGPGVVRRLLNLVCLWANVCVAACVCFCLCVSVLYNVCVSLSLSVCARFLCVVYCLCGLKGAGMCLSGVFVCDGTPVPLS